MIYTEFFRILIVGRHIDRKQGIGKAVVEAIENEIERNAQVDKILSGVQVNNPKAMQFWQRNGYRIVSEPKLHPDQTTTITVPVAGKS
jgi:GNAT superfamily N-acetyltransferase